MNKACFQIAAVNYLAQRKWLVLFGDFISREPESQGQITLPNGIVFTNYHLEWARVNEGEQRCIVIHLSDAEEEKSIKAFFEAGMMIEIINL